MEIRIFGAGMAGLLAAQMLRRYKPVVYEAQPERPDNHGALLRFRSEAVSRETGIPFRRVRVIKAVKSGGRLRPVSTLADANLYSAKVTGEIMPRSVLDLSPCERYIAPPDFLSGLALGANITYGREMVGLDLQELREGSAEGVIISTIPMPALMAIAGWPNPPAMNYRPIWSVTMDVHNPPLDVHQTIYYPEPDTPYYRASITGNRVIVEYATEPDGADYRQDLAAVRKDFGLPFGGTSITLHAPKRQEYGKLLPVDDRARQEFILAMTDEFRVYSVGRFATWRQILLDDVVNDVRVVESMITQRSHYTRRLAAHRHTIP
jgi:hypothetical protein